MTGGAATTETAEEGLVIGDRVNTAARIQSAAPPGCCYVDETTRSATAAAIAYSAAGEHTLKGKAEPVRLFQATRVVAAVAGSQRSGVIEAPFIGRDRELRLVKELFHGTAERHSARMVLVSGVAGIGKSRLSWEFFKYIDGLAGDVLWHSGRCLSYGEGVSYWALSEMVRARLQISEEDPPDLVAQRLRAGLERWIGDAADREFITPVWASCSDWRHRRCSRRRALLGLASLLRAPRRARARRHGRGRPAMGRRRTRRLPRSSPRVVGDHAIFLLVLTRPEGTDRRGLALSRRNVTNLSLDPLSDEVMGELLDGLVSGLPVSARARIIERAEGIPLYAIETVRGLLDKGVLEKGDDGSLHLVGELGELEIPPGLTALIASRLDALSPEERRLVKECSVLGGSFPRQAIGALSEIEPALLDELLSSLVRKEVLTVRADKLSPERGQYAFTQSLIRSVAYDSLTRAERKARHLRTAEHLRTAFPDEGAEVAEVIAAHLLDAYQAAGEDPDADELRAEAREAYTRAGERAEAVGALEAAESAYLKAVALSSQGAEQAALTERAGQMAQLAGWYERSVVHFEKAIATYVEAGHVVDTARVTGRLGTSLDNLGRGEQAIARLYEALASLEATAASPEVVADLQVRLGGALVFSGHVDEATGPLEEALTLAQHHELGEQLAQGLSSKAVLLSYAGRAEEAKALFELCVSVSRREGLPRRELTAESNLADLCMTHDLPGAEEHAEAALALARRWGLRANEAVAANNLMYALTMAGRLVEANELGTALFQAGGADRPGAEQIHYALACLEALRGNADAAREHIEGCRAWAETDDVQSKASYSGGHAAVLLAENKGRQAIEAARRAIDEAFDGGLSVAHEAVRLAFPIALEASIDLGDSEEADRLANFLATRPRGEVPPFLRAQLKRARALVARARGEDEAVEDNLVGAEALFRDLGYPYWTARAQLDRADWLASAGRPEEAVTLATQAAATFERVGVYPMLARAKAFLEPETVRTLAVEGGRAVVQSSPSSSE